MDPIEKYIKQVAKINIKGHDKLYHLTNSWNQRPIPEYQIDGRIDSETISRLRWSRYNVLFFFARVKKLSSEEFPKLFDRVNELTGELHYKRLVVIFDIFRNIGTLLDSLSEEANIVYELGLKKEKITIIQMRKKMQNKVKTKSTQKREFMDKIIPMLSKNKFNRIMDFRNLATHRPKLIRLPGGMCLPIDPKMDPDDESQHGVDAFMPKEKPAVVDVQEMVSYVHNIIVEFYEMTNRHFRELYTKKVDGSNK